jgi:hypothetical protein
MNIHNLKEGDFFITSNGTLGKVIEILSNSIKSDTLDLINKDTITNFGASLNQLVKAGDYVNGLLVYKLNDSDTLYINNKPLSEIKINHFVSRQEFSRVGYYVNQQNTTELWKDIDDFPSYEVSNTGKVRVKKTWKIMSYLPDREQLSVRLVNAEGLRRRKSVAVLVLEAFKGCQNGCMPKFIDGNTSNCKLDNLTWESRVEQAKRVLPKRDTSEVKYKYQYIIGYFNNTPVIHALNTRELSNFLKTYCQNMNSLQLTHLSRSISMQRPYKGILFKCVSKEEYGELSQHIQNLEFSKIYKEQILNSNLKELNTKAKLQTTPVIKRSNIITHKSRSRLDDIDDSEFYREQEELERRKRQEFKEKLMALLNKYNSI